ncbi:unnamed protein product, partial [Ascophyllum nodosum]
FEARDIVENHEVVVETVADLSTLGIGDATGMAQNSGEDAKEDDEGTLTAFNGDSSFRSVEGKDTLFLKELRVRAEEWEANGRSFDRQVQRGDSGFGGGLDVTPNGPLESPRPMGGGPRAGGKGRKSIGGGSKAGPKAPKGGHEGNADGEVPEPGGRGFKPSGGGFEPGREDPKPSG